jgi:hypothetical protein
MRFSKLFSVLSLTIAAMAMPNTIPNTSSTTPTCDANVGGELACCATTQQVSKHQSDVLPKLFSALHSPGGLLNGLLQTVYLLLQVPVNVNAGIECVSLPSASQLTHQADLIVQGSVTVATVNDCKQQATCCNFGNQVVAGHQSSVSFAIYSGQCCY